MTNKTVALFCIGLLSPQPLGAWGFRGHTVANLAAVESIRPTGIIGVSTVPKLFDQHVIEAMARINERPIVFP